VPSAASTAVASGGRGASSGGTLWRTHPEGKPLAFRPDSPFGPASIGRRRIDLVRVLGVAILVGALCAATMFVAIATNMDGVGDRFEHVVVRVERFVAGPPPDRATVETVVVTSAPSASPSAVPASIRPGATATPAPVRRAVDVKIVSNPAAHFASEERKDWCAPAGVQMVLSVLGRADTSTSFQEKLAGRIGEWESARDSKNGE
jgi:hypothetical protein